jgi:predicted dehydrogenase
MTQMGIHLTDMLVWFFGKVTDVHAITANRSLGWETGDVVTVQMRFEAGMTATMQAILHTPHFLRTHVFGSEEWIEIRNETHPDTPDGDIRMERYRAIDDRKIKTFEWTDSVTANLEAWADAIAGAALYPYSDFEMIHNIEVFHPQQPGILSNFESNARLIFVLYLGFGLSHPIVPRRATLEAFEVLIDPCEL